MHAASFIADHARELAHLARRDNLHFMAYLLEMAVLEGEPAETPAELRPRGQDASD